MKNDAKSSDLERRKHVKLRVRGDLQIAVHKYEGRTYYVVKDPVCMRYYRFKEQEHFLLKMMDGKHSLDQTQKEFEKRFRPERLTLEDLEQFGQQLLTAGLAQNDSPTAGTQLFERKAKRTRTERFQTWTNILYIKIPAFDPEKLLTWMLPHLRFIFTSWFFFLSLAFMMSAVMLVLTHFDYFWSKLPSYQEFFSFKTAIYLWISLGVVKVIHEFGHGLSCKAFGGEVHEMGLLFLCLSPAMYCNVSDAWTMPNKWHRIIISFAGIYVELMIAAVATFVWWNSPGSPFINYLSLSLMIVCSVSTVIFNGNPLMRYDGYYVLADWIEIPNLRDRANRYIQRLAMEHLLGIETMPEPYMDLNRRILFITFAVISWVYRWFVTFAILLFMGSFLKPYKLEVISQGMALMSLFTMFGWPIIKLFKNVKKRGRLPDMKSGRMVFTGCLVAGFLACFFLIPLPVTRVRQTGIVQVQPDSLDVVYVETPGILKKVHVKEGEAVRKGKILAEFYSPELATRRNSVVAKETIRSNMIKAYDSYINDTRDPMEIQRFKEGRDRIRLERSDAQVELAEIDRDLTKLVLRAPRDGIVVGLPKIDEIGKKWEREQAEPFCSIGDPNKLRVLVPISPGDVSIVRDNDRRHPERKVPATIRVQGRGAMIWVGHVSQIPEAEAKTIPLALSNRGGGPLAVKQSEDPNTITPQNQVFLVSIDFDQPDAAICPGSHAQVKIHNDYRSAAWWTWRSLSTILDLPLL